MALMQNGAPNTRVAAARALWAIDRYTDGLSVLTGELEKAKAEDWLLVPDILRGLVIWQRPLGAQFRWS